MRTRELWLGLTMLAVLIDDAHAVGFQFDWKPGMSCRVNHAVSKTQSGQPVAEATFTMKASAASEDRMLIEVADFALADPLAAADFTRSGIDSTDLAAINLPNFYVHDGAFAGLQDPKRYRNAWRKVVEAHPEWPKDPAKIEAGLDKFATVGMQESVVRLFWNPAVEGWVGANLAQGKKFSAPVEDVLPLGNLPYKAEVERQNIGMRPCADNQAAPRCVLLEAHQTPDPASLKELSAKVAEIFHGQRGDFDIMEIEMRSDTELLTHPETLVPVHVRVEKNVTLKGKENGKPLEQSTHEVREWKFDCSGVR